MAGIARVGVDKAGGIITGSLSPTVNVNGSPIAVKNAGVLAHGSATHTAPIMQQASSTVFAQGKAVCRAGDAATCGHTASGSTNVNAG